MWIYYHLFHRLLFNFGICDAWPPFLFESVCVLPVVCVIVYGEMRQCFECFEVVDGIAMIWLKGFAFCVGLFEVGVRFG